MKRVRVCSVFVLSFALAAILSAAGRKDAPLSDAAGLRNWEKEFDISGKKPGVYNIVVEGRDQAGNVTVAGPINVFVDPKTDLPIALIANPTRDMRVSGDLNIVGTCVDDDGPAKVELSLDGGDWFAAEGSEFWSFTFKAADIPDGRRSLSVRAVDVNGTVGPVRTVAFDMDKRRPVETVEAPVAGTLVAGRVSLRGSIFDANGVVSVDYSLDGGKTFSKTKGSYDKKAGIRSFSAPIDTRKMSDGPSVALLRSVDGVGSVALAPVLLVVDNTKPVVALVSPTGAEAVDGDFALFGYAKDEVGLKSLHWKIGDRTGEIAVNPGDPFWTVPVSLAKRGGKDFQVSLIAEDTIGNKTEARYRVPLDAETDKPVVTLLSPSAELRTEGSVFLSGYARDDDAVAAIEYWVDKQPPLRVETSGSFGLRIADLAPGKRIVSVRAYDVNGLAGPIASVQIEDIGQPPAVSIAGIVYEPASKEPRVEPFSSGVSLAPDSKAAFRFSLRSSPAAGARISALEWKLSGPDGSGGTSGTVPVKGAEGTALLPLPSSGPFGALVLSVRAADSYGREARDVGLVHVVDYSSVRGDPSFVFADERLDADGSVRFPAGESGRRPFRGRFVGATLASARLEPESPGYSLSLDGPFVAVVPVGDGANGTFKIVGTTDRGHVFESRDFRLLSDLSGPKLSIDAGASPFVGQSAVLSGAAEDASGVASVSYSLGSGDSAAEADLSAIDFNAESGRFELPVDLSSLPDGMVRVAVKAVDAAGNESVRSVEWVKDTEAPLVEFIAPGTSFGGKGIAVGYARDSGGVASLSFASDGRTFAPLNGREAFALSFDPSLASEVRLKAVDRAGNERVVPLPENGLSEEASAGADAPGLPAADAADAAGPAGPAAAVDPKALPSLTLLYPAPEARLAGAVPVLFRLDSPRAAASVSWTFGAASGTIDPSQLVPQTPSSSADRGGAFLCVFVAEGIGDKQSAPQLRVAVSDAAGKSASASVKTVLVPETLKPVPTIRTPAEAETAPSSLSVGLSAAAPRGVASYRLSLDGGEPRSAESAGTAVFELDGLSPGPHSLTVVAVDSFGVESPPAKRTFKVVGPAPSFSSFSFQPGDGLTALPGMKIEGSFAAPNGAQSVEVSIAGRPAVKAAVTKLENGGYGFSVAVPADLAFDRADVVATVSDKAGFSAVRSSFFYKITAAPESGVFAAPGLYAADARLPADQGVPVRVSDDAPFMFRFLGRPVADARLEPPSDLLSVSFDGASVRLTPLSDGAVPPTRLIVRDADGDEFSWGPLPFEIRRSDPVLEAESPADGVWVRDSIPLTVRATDSFGVPETSYSLDGENWLALPSDGSPIPLEGPDGAYRLRVRAVNASGRSATVERMVNKDTQPPTGAMVVPRSDDAVNGRTTLAVRFADPGGALAALEFSLDGNSWESADRNAFASRQVDFSSKEALPTPRFRATDAAGNVTELSPAFVPDSEADKPRTLVQLPEEMEVVRTAFSVSGAAFDDDGVAAVSYRFDGGEWTRLPLEGNGFSIPVSFAASPAGDNEHLVEVFAEDIYGVVGEVVARKYRVSREEPKASVEKPKLETTSRSFVLLEGAARDANGIASVDISFDNAATFSRAVLDPVPGDPTKATWSYRLDTRILADGLHSIYVRPVDSYGTEGFFASLVSVDNTPPKLTLDLPADGSTCPGRLPLSGRADDTRKLKTLFAVVFPLGGGSSGEKRFDLEPSTVVLTELDLSGLADGSYGLRLTAVDEAGNEAVVTRDFSLKNGFREEFVRLASPVAGERLSGKLVVQGLVRSASRVSAVSVFVDGADFVSAKPDGNGWFSAELSGGGVSGDLPPLADGDHSIEVRFANDAGAVVSSGAVAISFAPQGPWVRADSFSPGAYVPYRPYLSGRAGWTPGESAEVDAPTPKEAAALKKGREPVKVEVSTDNGRTFAAASGKAKWKFRLETQDFAEGVLPVLVRARFRNGETTVCKLLLNLDKTPPKVSILDPAEGGRFNGSVSVSGVASDDTELVSVSLALRDGDKAGYELPSFIQGMYLDAHVFGEPVYEAGAGFTFFEDNVKLQFAYGYTPAYFMGQDRGRFHGNVFSAKLLANLLTFPFGFWLGPDWEFLSANVAVGANFSYFSETQSTTLETSSGTIIGAVVGQLEFPKLKFRNLKMFRSYSFYTELQAWFVSAELDGGIKPAITVGARIGLF